LKFRRIQTIPQKINKKMKVLKTNGKQKKHK